MVDYPDLAVRLPGFAGLAEAQPTGRFVVAFDSSLPAAVIRAGLPEARVLASGADTAALYFDDDDVAISSADMTERVQAAVPLTSQRLKRVSRVYRIGAAQISPQPEYLVAVGELRDAKEKLRRAFREAGRLMGIDHGRFGFGTKIETFLGDGKDVHVFSLHDDGEATTDPDLALFIASLNDVVDGDAHFEVTSYEALRGGAGYPTCDVTTDGPPMAEYSDFMKDTSISEDTAGSPVPGRVAVLDGYFQWHKRIRYTAFGGANTTGRAICGRDAHGTACAGLVGASGFGGFGDPVEGFGDAEILPITVYDPALRAHDDLAVARGIRAAVYGGASVISLSLARSVETSSVIEAAIHEANKKKVVVVAAAGNALEGESDQPVWYPAAYPDTVAVGAATISSGRLARVVDAPALRSDGRGDDIRPTTPRWSSAYGPNLDLVADGRPAKTTGITKKPLAAGKKSKEIWEHFRGTSAAAPFAAGVAARIGLERSLQGDELRAALIKEATARAAESPGFNSVRNSQPFSEQLGYGWIERAKAPVPAQVPTSQDPATS